MDFEQVLEREGLLIENHLERYLPSEDEIPFIIHKAIRYSVFSGGKRLRPLLVLWAYRWAGGIGDGPISVACAMELIHTYSLIHDDLPCMDNDDLRRGKPTCHRAFTEGIATLAGDALHALAFELLAVTGNIQIIREVAHAIGTKGLVGGQVIDLLTEGHEFNEETLKYIHYHKTASLITVALRCGALLAGANTEEMESITNYGTNLGLAFQIVDDILDIKGNTTQLGKTVGSDENKGKATYPRLFGIERSESIAGDLIDCAKGSLPPDKDNTLFFELADFVINRVY
ncbi:polyprenyl synthetase family protein [bacterium]|nr:polyprenyl synthetase family protein [bacterium]